MNILGILGLIFIVLKLTSVIAWSWWLVLLPFYFWLAVVLVFGIIGIGTLSLWSLLAKIFR